MSATHLVNDNQGRHIGAFLRLLCDDLHVQRALLGADRERAELRTLIDDVERQVAELLRVLGLPVASHRDPGRRLRALAGVWRARIEDLRPDSLRGWGKVDPTLAGTLDPGLDRIAAALDALAAGAAREAGQ